MVSGNYDVVSVRVEINNDALDLAGETSELLKMRWSSLVTTGLVGYLHCRAYREELERKVEHLKQENARRKKELETSIAAASGQLSITHNHRRSSSALF
ncbi:hypothetical protein ACLB2K_023815 [Fragaria x ananassa]